MNGSLSADVGTEYFLFSKRKEIRLLEKLLYHVRFLVIYTGGPKSFKTSQYILNGLRCQY